MTRGLLVLALLLAGCATPKMLHDLETARDRATQEEVKSRYGSPLTDTPQPGGGAVWTYRHLAYEPDPPFAPSSCTEYRLTFDAGHVLRAWSEHPC
jgi:nitrate reductase cytochrome c-type subunit